MIESLADGLWRWTARHPEWHPATALGAEVACFAARAGDDTLLVDPLLDEAILPELDAIVSGRAITLITIPYHVRSAVTAHERYGAHVHGHAKIGARLPAGVPFHPFAAGDELPHGVTAHAIGKPRRMETPLHLPEHRALAFGDAVVGIGGGLRIWLDREPTEKVRAWLKDRFAPSLRPLLDLHAERVLVTHGEPVLSNGCAALEAALSATPHYEKGDF